MLRSPWVAVLLASLMILQAPSALAVSPSYASVGSFVSYTAQGGYIPYFSGVEGNITYTVASVFPNGSMALSIFENITAGTDLNPFVTTINVTDSLTNPAIFPAAPISNLSTGHIRFQNVTAAFLKNDTASVPAGTFHTMEFTGAVANGTSVHFWFDRATGIMVEENSGTSAVELDSSNAVTPSGPPAGFNGEVAYELVFVLAFAIGGGAFLSMRYYYTRSAQKRKDAANAGQSRTRTARRGRRQAP